MNPKYIHFYQTTCLTFQRNDLKQVSMIFKVSGRDYVVLSIDIKLLYASGKEIKQMYLMNLRTQFNAT